MVTSARSVFLTAALVLACVTSSAHAEGSVDVNTGTNPALVRHILTVTTTSLSPPYTVLRVYANAGERIEMGSSAMGLGGQADIVVYPPGSSFNSSSGGVAPLAKTFPFATPLFDCNTDSTTAGRGVLNSRAKELAGPGGASGYTPCSFIAPATGIYPVILFSVDPTSQASVTSGTLGSPNVTANQKTYLSLWDVTVVRPNGSRAPGRVFTNIIGLRAYNNANVPPPGMADFHGYVLTGTGYVYEFTFFNHSGINWNLLSDSRGLYERANGKTLYASFRYQDPPAGAQHSEAVLSHGSDPDQAIDPRYPIFFNEPDPVAISGPGGLGATEHIPSVPLSPSTTRPSAVAFAGEGPAGGPGQTTQGYGGMLSFSSPAALNGLTFDVGIDFDGNGSFDDPVDFVSRGNPLSDSGNVVHWDGKMGDGQLPPCGTYQAAADVALSDVHFTQTDVENSGGMRLRRVSLPSEPSLGDPLATSYDDTDPFKASAVTNAAPVAALPGTSGPGFHAWTDATGDLDYIDTWNRLPTLHAPPSAVVVQCPVPALPPPQYDLGVRKSASDLRVVIGTTFSYTLAVHNAGPDAAPADAIVTDRVPAIEQVVDVQTDRGTCGHTGNDVICNVGALPAGADAMVTIRARAIETGASQNLTVVGVPPGPPVDSLADNVARARVAVIVPSLGLSKSANPRRTRRGGTTSFTLRVRNRSQAAVSNVLVCDRLGTRLRFVSSNPRSRAAGHLRCWRIASLGAGETRDIRVRARAVGSARFVLNRAFAAAPLAGLARASTLIRMVTPIRFTG
ncbi:MAG TPA: hypothetical protein VH300_16745 [Thermoleophilaceae bacterium]|nr:hypothetical protein [Thermoleophilaceae bacterium]